jgi:aconitate hydratase 2/2-methylisocitrate dehydratase
LSSAEIAAISAKLGRIPTLDEYQKEMEGIEPMSGDIYQYLNFDKLDEYKNEVKNVPLENIPS